MFEALTHASCIWLSEVGLLVLPVHHGCLNPTLYIFIGVLKNFNGKDPEKVTSL